MSSTSGFQVLKPLLNPKRVKLASLRITFSVASHLPGQNSFEMLCTFTTFTPKTVDPILSQINATLKCSTKCIFKRSPLLTYFEITFTSTAD